MGVKTIFKVLIGTIVIMFVSSITVELFNISTTGLQINQISRMAGRQAAILFSQETYKQFDIDGRPAGAIRLPNIYDANGIIYIDGNVYPPGDDAREIYMALYNSESFRDWVRYNQAVRKGNWHNLNLINRAINNPESLNIPFGQPGHDDAMLAKMYKEVMMTPTNLGVPYLDRDTLNNMFIWNLAQLLSNHNPNSIRLDEQGNQFIAFRGFRVYANLAYISNIEYRTFDLTEDSDRIEFNRITSLDPDRLGFQSDNLINISDDERTRVMIAGIYYRVPMTYEGITPIRRLFNFIWETEVEGMNGNNRQASLEWNDHLAYLESGGFASNLDSGVLPVPGRLIYYIIR